MSALSAADLDEMEKRARAIGWDGIPLLPAQLLKCVAESALDVPALVAEVRRLRMALEEAQKR